MERREEKALGGFSVDEFNYFLIEKGLPQDVTTAIQENGVSGDIFMELSEDNLKEVAPRLSDIIALKQIQQSHQPTKVSTPLNPRV